jgi:hypothetical protein
MGQNKIILFRIFIFSYLRYVRDVSVYIGFLFNSEKIWICSCAFLEEKFSLVYQLLIKLTRTIIFIALIIFLNLWLF